MSDSEVPTPAGGGDVEQIRDAMDDIGSRPIVMPILVAANAIVFVAMVASGVSLMEPLVPDIVRWGGNIGALTQGGEWWRLFTSMFVHIGVIHIAMNMAVLWDAGRVVERLVGRSGFLAMYVVSGLLGSVASLMWNANVVSAGASGAVFGLFGCILGMLVRDSRSMPAAVRGRIGKVAGFFVFYNVIFGAAQTGIDMAAHIGGLVAGFACGLALALPLGEATAEKRRGRAAMVAVVGIVAVAIGAVTLATPGQITAMIDPDKVVRSGQTEIYYADGATRTDAKAVSKVLFFTGFFQKSRRASAVVSKPDGTFVVGIVVRAGVEDDPEMTGAMASIGQVMSSQAFDGEPVILELLDRNLVRVKRLDAVDATTQVDRSNPSFRATIDLRALRASALFASYGPALESELTAELSALHESCGTPIVSSLRSISVRHVRDDTDGYVISVSGIGREVLETCLKNLSTDEEPVTLDLRGEQTMLTVAGLEVLMHWADADVFLIEIEPGMLAPVPVTDNERLAARASQPDSAALKKAASKLQDGAVLWIAFEEPRGLFQVVVTDRVALKGRTKLPNKRAAQVMVDLLEENAKPVLGLPSMQALFAHLTMKLRRNGAIAIDGSVSEEQLLELVAAFAADEELARMLGE